MCDSVGFDGHFTYHFFRTKTASRLCEAKVDKKLILQRTAAGHTISTMKAYKCADKKLRVVTSDISTYLIVVVIYTKDEPEDGNELQREQ